MFNPELTIRLFGQIYIFGVDTLAQTLIWVLSDDIISFLIGTDFFGVL